MAKKTSLFKTLGLGIFRGGLQPLPLAGQVTKHLNLVALTSLTDGTDTAGVAGTRFTTSIQIPYTMTMTGIGYLIGSVGGTDDVIVELHDADGILIANSGLTAALAPTCGTLATFQEVSFTAPVEVLGPGTYFLSVTFAGATAKLRTVPTARGASQVLLTKSATGTFGTTGNLTVPTTFTAGVGPIAYTF